MLLLSPDQSPHSPLLHSIYPLPTDMHNSHTYTQAHICTHRHAHIEGRGLMLWILMSNLLGLIASSIIY